MAGYEEEILSLAKRIRLLMQHGSLSRNEIGEIIMGSKNPPSEENFLLAYAAAEIASKQTTPSPNG